MKKKCDCTKLVNKGEVCRLINCAIHSIPTPIPVPVSSQVTSLPNGVLFSQTNYGHFYLRKGDGIVIVREKMASAATGAYNGTGGGNKAVLSFNEFGGRSIYDFEYITFTAKRQRTPSAGPADGMYLNIYVKNLDSSPWTLSTFSATEVDVLLSYSDPPPNPPADDTGDSILVVDSSPTGIPSNLPINTDNTTFTYTVNATESVWKIVVSAGFTKYGLYSNQNTTGLPLTSYVPPTDPAPYMNPVLWNGVVTDNGLPLQYSYGAISLCFGSSSGLNPDTIVIGKVQIKFKNSALKTYDFTQ